MRYTVKRLKEKDIGESKAFQIVPLEADAAPVTAYVAPRSEADLFLANVEASGSPQTVVLNVAERRPGDRGPMIVEAHEPYAYNKGLSMEIEGEDRVIPATKDWCDASMANMRLAIADAQANRLLELQGDKVQWDQFRASAGDFIKKKLEAELQSLHEDADVAGNSLRREATKLLPKEFPEKFLPFAHPRIAALKENPFPSFEAMMRQVSKKPAVAYVMEHMHVSNAAEAEKIVEAYSQLSQEERTQLTRLMDPKKRELVKAAVPTAAVIVRLDELMEKKGAGNTILSSLLLANQTEVDLSQVKRLRDQFARYDSVDKLPEEYRERLDKLKPVFEAGGAEYDPQHAFETVRTFDPTLATLVQTIKKPELNDGLMLYAAQLQAKENSISHVENAMKKELAPSDFDSLFSKDTPFAGVFGKAGDVPTIGKAMGQLGGDVSKTEGMIVGFYARQALQEDLTQYAWYEGVAEHVNLLKGNSFAEEMRITDPAISTADPNLFIVDDPLNPVPKTEAVRLLMDASRFNAGQLVGQVGRALHGMDNIKEEGIPSKTKFAQILEENLQGKAKNAKNIADALKLTTSQQRKQSAEYLRSVDDEVFKYPKKMEKERKSAVSKQREMVAGLVIAGMTRSVQEMLME